MADILFKLNFHYSARDLDEPSLRERVEQALFIACTELEKYGNTEYIGYKIKEHIDLGEEP